jgi:hypothetical protein
MVVPNSPETGSALRRDGSPVLLALVEARLAVR